MSTSMGAGEQGSASGVPLLEDRVFSPQENLFREKGENVEDRKWHFIILAAILFQNESKPAGACWWIGLVNSNV